MRNTFIFNIYLGLFFSHFIKAQTPSGYQYPFLLKNASFGVKIGYIQYPFSNDQVEPGFMAEKIEIPHTAVNIHLYSQRINDIFRLNITYMRPVYWVRYHHINGNEGSQSVWTNIAGLTVEGNVPLTKQLLLSAECGFGIITRSGFKSQDKFVVKDANLISGLFGGSLKYRINTSYDLVLKTQFSPEV